MLKTKIDATIACKFTIGALFIRDMLLLIPKPEDSTSGFLK